MLHRSYPLSRLLCHRSMSLKAAEAFVKIIQLSKKVILCAAMMTDYRANVFYLHVFYWPMHYLASRHVHQLVRSAVWWWAGNGDRKPPKNKLKEAERLHRVTTLPRDDSHIVSWSDPVILQHKAWISIFLPWMSCDYMWSEKKNTLHFKFSTLTAHDSKAAHQL